MNKEQIEDVFTRCGLGSLGEKLAYKLWVKGIGESCDEEMLEGFLLGFDVKDESTMLLDEFCFHLQLFQKVMNNEGLRALYFS